MRDQVAWHVELAIKPSKLDNFRRLTNQMVESARREEGVLTYERFISADGTVVHVYERYADSDAAVAHLRLFAQTFGQRLQNMVERKRFSVFGVASDELKTLLNGFTPTYFGPLGGFSR
jgi:quinol monooxygenase YgiN